MQYFVLVIIGKVFGYVVILRVCFFTFICFLRMSLYHQLLPFGCEVNFKGFLCVLLGAIDLLLRYEVWNFIFEVIRERRVYWLRKYIHLIYFLRMNLFSSV
jgi:hypothetical protein